MDIISAVEELSGYPLKELTKLLKDSDNFTIQSTTRKGSLKQIDVERLSTSLPLHLIAVLLSPEMEMPLTHLLRGVRLLHALSDLASRHARFEQILLDEVRYSEQILDLVFFMLTVLARYEQVKLLGTSLPFVHSALVATTLHLLSAFISSQWHDLVHILLAHPQVDIFMDMAFDAVHVDVRFLNMKLSALSSDVLCNKSSRPAAERTIHYLCQQCEASLHFLLSLCQQKLFRDRLLNNKEVCKSGGILLLARTALKLSSPECFKDSFEVAAAVSRIKAKVLSILLQLCESESISYLDEVAGSAKCMRLARSLTLEIVDLLKTAFRSEAKCLNGPLDKRIPKGLVLLNSLRLADIFSDDSNFRAFFLRNIIEVLVEILAFPREEFRSNWCSDKLVMVEEDAIVDYDSFTAAGMALVSFTGGCESASAPISLNETSSGCPSVFNGIHSVTYAQQRTSYLVKIIANLHCFVPNICEEEERNLFLNKFHQCLLVENHECFSRYPPNSYAIRAATICENLSSLSNHAASLIPSLLNDDDVQLLRLFSDQLQKLNPHQGGDYFVQEPSLQVVEDSLGYKNEDHLSEPVLQPWSRFQDSKSNEIPQEDQSTPGSAPTILKKLEVIDQGGDRKDKDLDMKTGVSESSLGQQLDQLIVTSKPTISDDYDSDDLDLALSRRRERELLDNENLSRSLGSPQKEIQNKIEGIEQNFREDVDLRPVMGEVYKAPDSAKEGGSQEYKAGSVLGEEKQPRKRKRNIMNEKQIILIEKALSEEPEMQKNQASLQIWADKLSAQGAEITSSQLKNWVNNRKARLARAARENRTPFEGENSSVPNTNTNTNASQYYDSAESAGEEDYIPSSRGSTQPSQPKPSGVLTRAASAVATDHSLEPEQLVLVVDSEGKEVGKGMVFQVKGKLHGKGLEDRACCIVDLTELNVEKSSVVEHPLEGAGTTFEEAAATNGGIMRVAWDSNKVFPLP